MWKLGRIAFIRMSNLVLAVDYRPGDLLRSPAKVGVRLELHVALDALGVVDDGHLAVLVDPQLADDDVVHHSLHLPPGVVVPGLWKVQVCDAQGLHLQVLPLELGPHGELLPALPLLPAGALAVLSHHGRVVGHLLRDASETSMKKDCTCSAATRKRYTYSIYIFFKAFLPPSSVVRPITLVRFAQKRVERLAAPDGGRAVG